MFEGLTQINFSTNYHIYSLAYLIMPILLLYKIKIVDFNDSFLSKSNTDVLKGLFILIIIFHHISQRMTLPGLMLPFRTFGYLGVSIFFFLSGYGLKVSSLRNKNYLEHFFSKRISRVFIPYILLNTITMAIEHFVYNNNYNFFDIILYGLGIKLLDNTMWFINAIIFLYVVFYLSFKYFPKKIANVVLFVFSSLYWLVCAYLHFGSWWYNTIFCFWLGTYIGLHYQSVSAFLYKFSQPKKYLPLMAGISTIFTILYILGNTRLGGILHAGTIFQTASSITFIFFILIITIKLQPKAKVLRLFGGVSYEMYLVHMKVLNIYFLSLLEDNIYIYYLLVIVAAFILKGLAGFLQKLQSRSARKMSKYA